MNGTTDVEVLYVRGGHARDAADVDPDADGFDLQWDLGALDVDVFDHRADVSTFEDIRPAYARIGGQGAFGTDQYDSVEELLEEIYSRCQGPAVVPGIYDGREHRSMRSGDVVLVDGAPYMVASFGFEPVPVSDSDDGEAR